MRKVKAQVPAEQRAAFFQLVEHPIARWPISTSSTTPSPGIAGSRCERCARELFADRPKQHSRATRKSRDRYHALNGGKWDGMMSQTHIGYTTWQQPEKDVMPEVKRVSAGAAPAPIKVRAARCSVGGKDEIAIDAARFTRSHDGKGLTWRTIPNLGRGAGRRHGVPAGTRRHDAGRCRVSRIRRQPAACG